MLLCTTGIFFCCGEVGVVLFDGDFLGWNPTDLNPFVEGALGACITFGCGSVVSVFPKLNGRAVLLNFETRFCMSSVVFCDITNKG